MGRPKSNNPKNKYIGIVTTEDKYRRFKRLNLVGDRAIDVLLYYLEKDNQKIQLEKILIVENIKKIDKEMKELEYERLKMETELDEINKKIGLSESGLSRDVERAIRVILERFNNQSIYGIEDFLDENEELLKAQAYLCGIDKNKLYTLVSNQSEG